MLGTNAVIDISHHQTVLSFGQMKEAGIVGILHKATQDTGYIDPTYADHKAEAESAGLLWGAYHFGSGSDPTEQANHFLDVVGDPTGILLALDFEQDTTDGQTTMSLAQAESFVTTVQQRTGKWPGLYGGSLIKQLLGNNKDPVLANCFLWLTEWEVAQPDVPANWQTWTFWQYTNTGTVPGISGVCDRDTFNGTQQQLTDFWAAAAPAATAAVTPVIPAA